MSKQGQRYSMHVRLISSGTRIHETSLTYSDEKLSPEPRLRLQVARESPMASNSTKAMVMAPVTVRSMRWTDRSHSSLCTCSAVFACVCSHFPAQVAQPQCGRSPARPWSYRP